MPNISQPDIPLRETAQQEGAPPTERYVFVDAIRALAALAVILRHVFFNEAIGPTLARIFTVPLYSIGIGAAAGVYAFFVLSGFVIAHSLRNNPLSWSGIGNFILRRQVRLDPPYWIVIFFVTGFSFLIPNAYHPTINNVVLNMFYLHRPFHRYEIVSIAWTLCLEVQFYLLFILMLKAGRPRSRPESTSNVSDVSIALVFGLGVVSLVLKHFHQTGWFISFWHYFAIGTLAYWVVNERISLRLFGIYAGLFALSTICSPIGAIRDLGMGHSYSFISMLVGLLTALSLVYAGLNQRLQVWGRQRFLQYTGKISYSLYLVHTIVLFILLAVAKRYGYEKPIVALGTAVATLLVSYLIAHLLYMAVEKPSLKLAARLKKSY